MNGVPSRFSPETVSRTTATILRPSQVVGANMSGQAPRIWLSTLRNMKARGQKFAMLTAYDYPTAAAAQAAGVHSLLIGDSLGNVVLGELTTRTVPLDLMIILGTAVRRGAPAVYFVGDIPYVSMQQGEDAVLRAAERFVRECGCDAVKFEAQPHHETLVRRLHHEGYETIAHLGLRPQSVTTPDGYRAQARDETSIAALVQESRRMVAAGASMLLLEAVTNEASIAVLAAVDVPVIGCGAGPACDGHVVVTHDMLGFGATRPPRFVPVLGQISRDVQAAMHSYVHSIESGAYPAPEHAYPMKRAAEGAGTSP
jgi:3-methyl-2-oxobutanoate hydroxymethyltransferase